MICPRSRNLALALWLIVQVNALASLPCLCEWGECETEGVFAAQLEAANPAHLPCGLCGLGKDARHSQDCRTATRPADRSACADSVGALPIDRPTAFGQPLLFSTAPDTPDAQDLQVFLE